MMYVNVVNIDSLEDLSFDNVIDMDFGYDRDGDSFYDFFDYFWIRL